MLGEKPDGITISSFSCITDVYLEKEDAGAAGFRKKKCIDRFAKKILFGFDVRKSLIRQEMLGKVVRTRLLILGPCHESRRRRGACEFRGSFPGIQGWICRTANGKR